jgi:hypothetical protein
MYNLYGFNGFVAKLALDDSQLFLTYQNLAWMANYL